MASFMDMLNAGIGGLNTPLGQLGTQLLAQSGPQAGNPGGASRLGQALAGMGDMQARQMLQQYRQAQIQQAEQQHALQMQQAQAKQDQQQQWQQRLQDPNFLASLGPAARQFAQLGVDPRDLIRATAADNLQAHRAATLQQQAQQFNERQAHAGAGGADHGPKVPTPRQILDEPLGDGMIQRHVFDSTSNGYKPYGKPFRQYAPPKGSPLDAVLMPDDNSGAGPAVPGLPGSSASMAPAPAPQGAELLMRQPGQAKPAAPMVTAGANPVAARKGMRVPGQAKPATPMTKADYDALPAGTQYIDPVSGKVAIKRGA